MLIQLKKNLLEIIKLLWTVKWYILPYIFIIFLLIYEYVNPIAGDDPIFNYETNRGMWQYTNADVYIGSLKNEIAILLLIFLLAISNIKNHPKMARFIFLSPFLYGFITIIIEWLM